MERAPFIGIARHRIGRDGRGVTTLVGFHGCPLHCRYCLNPQCADDRSAPFVLTTEELCRRVKPDALYFLSTGGGVTFGGGEPLLYPAFLEEFRRLCGREWRLTAETSLAVPEEDLRLAAGLFDEFLVDCKDVDPAVYAAYTGRDNDRMLRNLSLLCRLVGSEKILVRLPLIPGFNTEAHRGRSEEYLRAMGLTRFDRFRYRLPGDGEEASSDSPSQAP